MIEYIYKKPITMKIYVKGNSTLKNIREGQNKLFQNGKMGQEIEVKKNKTLRIS